MRDGDVNNVHVSEEEVNLVLAASPPAHQPRRASACSPFPPLTMNALDNVYRLYGVKAPDHRPPRSAGSPRALACAERWSLLVGAYPPWASPGRRQVLRKTAPSA